MRLFRSTSLALLALAGCGFALAGEEAATGNSNGIPYVSGGIGLESREALRAKEGQYNLIVILSRKDGHYLGGAAVTIRNQAGKTLLEVDAQGPWMFAKLPPGNYTVEAKAGNITQSKRFVIAKKAVKRVVLTWDKDPA
jgi:hypothetical protein